MFKNRKRIICVILALIIVISLCWVVFSSGSSGDSVLTIDYDYWNDMGTGGEGTKTLTDIKRKDIVFEDTYGTFKVKSVSPDKIVISIEGGGFSKSEGIGIDLRSKPLKTITVKKGESLTIDSQTMDAGVSLTFRYE